MLEKKGIILKKYDFSLLAASLAVLMLGLSYIAVPLYQVFCQTYGLGGTSSFPLLPFGLEGKGGKGIGIGIGIGSGDLRYQQKINWNKSESPGLGHGVNLQNVPTESLVQDQKKLVSASSLETFLRPLTQFFPAQIKDPVLSSEREVKSVLITQLGVDSFSSKLPSVSLSPSSLTLTERPITVFLSAENAKDLPWDLRPSLSKIKVFPGDTALTFYFAKNLSTETLTGVATYNIMPAKAGVYFNKIQCFCFEEQRLKGHESVELPVLFFIDSDFLNDPKMQDIDSLTLSYTFFRTSESISNDLF